MLRRCSVALVALGVLVALAAPAGAHVTIQPPEATQGGFATEVFQVPNERDDTGTTQVEVTFPEDNPIASVRVEAVPGWTVNVEKRTLDTPIEAFGSEISEVVSKITWSGGEIAPGTFQRFPVSMGPLPEVDSLEFKAVQTYADGEVVRWIEPTPASGEEPEHPAPVLTLKAGTEEEATTSTTAPLATADLATTSDVDSAKTVGIIGIVVGAVGVILGLVALLRKRTA